MRTTLLGLTMATVAAVGVANGFCAAPAAADERFAVVERATTDTVTDIGAVGDSPGDILTFANEIYDAPNAKLVGHNNGWCIRIVVGQSWECFWTLTLDRGQITVEGPYYDGKDSVLAVTGGTGAFDDVRGEMALHARNEQGTEYDFVYALED